MDWTVIVIALGVVGVWIGWKRLSLIPLAKAREYLRQGAQVIDVRSPREYQSHHLPGAINLPLGELAERVVRELPDRQAVLLLHCHSGGRSGVGKHLLRRLGYTRVFNLGSYGRAGRVLQSPDPPPSPGPAAGTP
jgi:rhodanese-related sulfurtransferase